MKETAAYSRVWREDGWIIKEQPKTLTDNEFYALSTLHPYGFVPAVKQEDTEVLRIEFIDETEPTDLPDLYEQAERILAMLRKEELRHGDLTEPHLLIRDNRLYIIDWGESRVAADPRPDKRREGDAYWLGESLRRKVGESAETAT